MTVLSNANMQFWKKRQEIANVQENFSIRYLVLLFSLLCQQLLSFKSVKIGLKIYTLVQGGNTRQNLNLRIRLENSIHPFHSISNISIFGSVLKNFKNDTVSESQFSIFFLFLVQCSHDGFRHFWILKSLESTNELIFELFLHDDRWKASYFLAWLFLVQPS